MQNTKVRQNSKVEMTVQGQKRNVFVGEQRPDGSYSARLRASGTGNSIRGVLRLTRNGPRFTASNRDSLNNL